jgi:hypothetical protein
MRISRLKSLKCRVLERRRGGGVEAYDIYRYSEIGQLLSMINHGS